jgi:hypothetical protein
MKVSALRKFLDLIDNEDAEVYILKEYADEGQNKILGTATELSSVANRKYVHPETKIIAQRPCQETTGCTEALMLYVKE